MDIATGANEVFAMMTHATKSGESKLANFDSPLLVAWVIMAKTSLAPVAISIAPPILPVGS